MEFTRNYATKLGIRHTQVAVKKALFEENPKRRYLVVPNQAQAGGTIRAAIKKIAQLNQRYAFSYKRDELVQMLDKALESNP